MKNISLKNIILMLFFASGITGLMYEVVWLRMLSRVLGVTTYATAITLAAFMAGLGIGSYFFGKLSDVKKNPLKIYMFLEIGIAITAALTPLLFQAAVPFYREVYELSGNSGTTVAVLRIIISFFTLLIPTILMGGTLPVMASFITGKDKLFGNNLSLLYGFNTLGAVIGVLLSGYFTIGSLGEWQTIFIAVAVNLTIVYVVLKLLKTGADDGTAQQQAAVQVDTADSVSEYSSGIRRFVLLTIFISGFTALAYEVIWTRQLILYLHVSIYSFSSMLAVFLTGIGLGSLLMNKFITRIKKQIAVFGIFQIFLGLYSVAGLYIFPLFDIYPEYKLLSPVFILFPIAFVFGMIFPLASVAYTSSISKTGESIGTLYGFNTLGNVLGSLVTGFLLIGALGSAKTIILLAIFNLSVGLILLYLEPVMPLKHKIKYALALIIMIPLVAGVYKKDVFLGIIEERIASKTNNYKIFLNEEFVQSTVTAYETNNNEMHLELNGVGQTVLCTETKLMAHIPYMITEKPKEFLAICFGMGTILRSAAIYPDLNISVVELVPEVISSFGYFHENEGEFLHNRGIKTYAEDGRNFLLLNKNKYDIISIDPSPPIYSAGTVNLYTKEFYELCKERLTDDGVLCMWIPAVSRENMKMFIKAFNSVFPDMSVWKGPHDWGFYMLGKKKPYVIDEKKIRDAFGNHNLVKDLIEYDRSCDNADRLLGLLIAPPGADLSGFIGNTPLLTDNNPYTEFPSLDELTY